MKYGCIGIGESRIPDHSGVLLVLSKFEAGLAPKRSGNNLSGVQKAARALQGLTKDQIESPPPAEPPRGLRVCPPGDEQLGERTIGSAAQDQADGYQHLTKWLCPAPHID